MTVLNTIRARVSLLFRDPVVLSPEQCRELAKERDFQRVALFNPQSRAASPPETQFFASVFGIDVYKSLD